MLNKQFPLAVVKLIRIITDFGIDRLIPAPMVLPLYNLPAINRLEISENPKYHKKYRTC
jgi:hypothetical protein